MDAAKGRETDRISQLLILGSYTALVVALAVETLLMSWELWALPLIFGGVAVSWFLHIRNRMSDSQRLWIYTVLMMGTFFFYGIHITSTYDMGLLMMLVMIIYTFTGVSALVSFCQLVYYLTLAYDLAAMSLSGTVWDSLLISRTALHAVLIFMAGWLARFIIRQWAKLFQESEEQIAALNKTARRMNTFMGNLSHELRTPVNAILGTTEVLLDGARDGETREQLLSVRNAGNRLAMQVSDIMDYSELETGTLTVSEEPYTLSSLIHDTVTELSGRMPDGLELVIDVDADTPAALVSDAQKLRKVLFHVIGNSLKYTREGGVYVHVSQIRQDYGVNLRIEVTDTGIGMSETELEQVFRRFYQADSGKAVRTGGLGLGLPIACGFVRALGGFLMIDSRSGEGTTVKISLPQRVADDQPCMSVRDRERVVLGGYLNIGKFSHPYVREFYNAMILNIVRGLGTPMHRVGSVEDLRRLTEKISLTHLFVGLEEYLSAPDYLETLAGKMNVVVVANGDFSLPAGSRLMQMPKPLYGFPIAEVLNAGFRDSAAVGKKLTFPGVRALVVDDEPMNLNVACGILRKYGMHVTTAHSGAQAIRLCRETPFDLVFMDHMMPEMDGVEAMKQLRQLFAESGFGCPILALTANALSSARERFLKEGFDGFLSKPIEIPELERVLKRVLPDACVLEPDAEPARPDPDSAAAVPLPVPSAPGAAGSGPRAAGPAEAAPSSPAADADAQSLALLKQTELNTLSALRYCQQDLSLYLLLLRQFADEQPEKAARLERFLKEEDYRNYQILAHALKSNAKMIGADALSDAARGMEAAAKNCDAAYLTENHAALLRDYRAVADTVRGCLPPEAPAPGAEEEELIFEPAEPEDGVLEFEPKGGA